MNLWYLAIAVEVVGIVSILALIMTAPELPNE